MSQENVEIARGWYEAVNRWLGSYWENPERPLNEVPGTDALFERLGPKAEWNWVFGLKSSRGRNQWLRAISDWIETVDDWRIEVEEVIDAVVDRVVATAHVHARGRGSGVPLDQHLSSVVTVRDGKVMRIDDYLDRAEALKAAGLSE
jgi:ketosteroid isomerase-like protein